MTVQILIENRQKTIPNLEGSISKEDFIPKPILQPRDFWVNKNHALFSCKVRASHVILNF